MHRGFRNAVHIDQPHRPGVMTLHPALKHGRIQRFATEHHHAQGQRFPDAFVYCEHLFKNRRRLVEHANLVLHQQLIKTGRRLGCAQRNNDQFSTMDQRAPYLPYGKIEGKGMEQGPHIP